MPEKRAHGTHWKRDSVRYRGGPVLASLTLHCILTSNWLSIPADLCPRRELMVPTGNETACAIEAVRCWLQIEHHSPGRTVLILVVTRTNSFDLSIKEVCRVILTSLSYLLYLIQDISPSNCAVTSEPCSFIVLNHRVFYIFPAFKLKII
jgi:hypothetical protein